jgi:hypothetical protein
MINYAIFNRVRHDLKLEKKKCGLKYKNQFISIFCMHNMILVWNKNGFVCPIFVHTKFNTNDVEKVEKIIKEAMLTYE